MKTRKFILLFTMFVFVSVSSFAENAAYVIPSKVENVKQPFLLLNGTWQFKYSPTSKWTTIEAPGEAVMQGYAIEHDKPFWYRKVFTLPVDYKGKRVILRFDGVYSQARLLVNGKFVREHHGGFTRWETDVTEFVKPGGKNEIMLEVTDRLDEISYASGYAHHPIGGILRDVTIFALPQTHIFDFRIETRLDTLYKDAVLQLSYLAEAANGAEIEYTLTDPDGKNVAIRENKFSLSNETGDIINKIPVSNPKKWDAEHPFLYTLTIVIHKDGKVLYNFSRKIGFRDIKIVRDRMLVNGIDRKSVV